MPARRSDAAPDRESVGDPGFSPLSTPPRGDGDQRAPRRERFLFWTEEKLRNMDTDQFGHVNNSAIATFLEAGRMEMLKHPAVRPSMDGISLVVVRLLMVFHKELFYPGMIEVGSVVTRIGRTSFDASQAIFASAGCVVSAEATCVLLNIETRRPHPVPDAVRRHLIAPAARS
ncbi:MAG TPA: thioesterase family protein [Alphaproteobacteria bacterium]|nr:thioesterase family protein [Alphaproteobacteria bacterium]